MVRTILAAAAELAGLALITAGCALISPVLALLVAGGGLVAVGLVLDPPAPRQGRS